MANTYSALDLYKASVVDIKPKKVIDRDPDEDDFYGFIYVIICLKTDKKYVGLTYRPVVKRWKEHVTSADAKHRKELYRDMVDYGIENFTFEVVCQAPVSQIPQLEIDFIAKFDSFRSGYNDTRGGSYIPGINGPVLTTRPTKEELVEALSTPRGKKGAMAIFHTDIHTLTSWITSYGIEDKWSCAAKGHRLSPEEKPTKEDMSDMILTMSIDQISALYGIEPSTTRYYLRKLNVVNPRHNDKVTGKTLKHEPSTEEIQSLVDKGMNASEIGRHFDISPRTMRKIMQRKGVKNPYSKNSGNKAVNKPNKAELERLLEDNMIKDIAKKYGVSGGAVRYWIKIYGIDYSSPYDHYAGGTPIYEQYTKKELEHLLEEHGTIGQAAKALNMSEGTLYAVFRTHGIKTVMTTMSTMLDV